MAYTPSPARYEQASLFRRCGRSGLKLPVIALGFWHNFGASSDFDVCRGMTLKAFDLGITHFDLANNYGPPPGSAETAFGKILRDGLQPHRCEMVIATKAGYDMWPGPYGNFGSRKYLLTSLDQSLKRMGLDYVDIFYHHRPDPETPLEETMGALAHAVRSGKALYAGLSNYNNGELAAKAIAMLRDMGAPCLIHQHNYSMFRRDPEASLFPTLAGEGVGGIAFCPLAQGLLTNRYLSGLSADSRAARDPRFLKAADITEEKLARIRRLDAIARARGQSLAQMALAWSVRIPGNDYALIGASKVSQIEENILAINNLAFSQDESAAIDRILA
ncbi:MAG: aldo/keto reductase [Opitutaceae bacterium]|jgi:L-glyceraldehyde 3-phosphate reductase